MGPVRVPTWQISAISAGLLLSLALPSRREQPNLESCPYLLAAIDEATYMKDAPWTRELDAKETGRSNFFRQLDVLWFAVPRITVEFLFLRL